MRTTITLIVFLTFLSGCYFKISKTLPELNPIEYNYNFPIGEVRKTIDNIFSESKFHGLFFKIGYWGIDTLNPENKNNFFLEYDIDFYSDSKIKSEIYYNWWGYLKLFPHYHIVLDSISFNQTKIKIISYPKVKTGLALDYNHGIPSAIGPFLVEVKPSTIEEYEIIKMIGDALGEKNMPEIKRAFRK